MKYEAIICDLDGTLLNTLEDIADSCNHILKTNGYPVHPIESYKYFIGEGAKKLIIRALPQTEKDEDTVQHCFDDYRNYYADNCENKTYVYDGIIELLKEVNKKKLKIAILTNKPQLHAEKCIKKYLNDIAVDIIIGQGNKDNLPPKPDTAGAIKIAHDFNIPTSKILYLGDSAIDMKTACAAGMTPVGVTWGFRSAKELQDNGAKYIVERSLDIVDLLN